VIVCAAESGPQYGPLANRSPNPAANRRRDQGGLPPGSVGDHAAVGGISRAPPFVSVPSFLL